MPRKIKLYDDNGQELQSDIIDPRLGKRIREVRRAKEMTIKELADMIGCSPTHVTRIETAKRRIDSTSLLVKFAQALGLPSEELITLAGMGVTDVTSLTQVAYPGVKTDKQKEVLNELSKLVTNMNLTDEQLDSLLVQATAFAEYCSRNNAYETDD